MSYSINRATIVGNLGSDPELRKTNSGTRVANLSVATSRTWTTDSGEEKERTEWHRVVCWGVQARIASRLEKGDRVMIEGRLQTRTWEDRKGRERQTTEVNARVILLIGTPEKSEKEKIAEAARAGAGGQDVYDEFADEKLRGDDDLPF